MKFAEKMIWSCLLTLVIVFSIGASIMLIQNHQHLLKTIIQQNLSSFDMNKYNLETRLEQDLHTSSTDFGTNQKKILNQAIYYLEQFHNMSLQQNVSYALSQNQNIIFSNINSEYHSLMTDQEQSTYFLKKNQNRYLMFIKNEIQIGNETYDLTVNYDMSYCYEERDRQIQSFTFISLFIFILAFIILKFVSHYMTKSIQKLNLASQRISQGQYSERTQIQSQDEIGELSRSFDRMAEINEQTIYQLQENVEQREQFMGSFSHEIKTPMTAILGFADLLRTCDCDKETSQKAAQYIYTEAKRLENLSYALMDLLSLSDHQIKLQPIQLQKVFHQLDLYYQGKMSSYVLSFDQTSLIVMSQQDLLFVLLRNLIDNAMKASQEGQCIDVQVRFKDSKVIISVRDRGIGMSEENAKKATEAFYMADKSRSRSQGGAGLGLAIVKRICDLHQTQLLIDSKLNEGTVVSFQLEVYDE